jgi:uncharacterized protein with PIN domain
VRKKIRAMSEACLEKAEVCLECKKPISEKMRPEEVYEEVPKEEAAVKTVTGL